MSNKNFDRAFYFVYSPGLTAAQHQAMIGIEFESLHKDWDFVDMRQSAVGEKIVVTIFAKKKS